MAGDMIRDEQECENHNPVWIVTSCWVMILLACVLEAFASKRGMGDIKTFKRLKKGAAPKGETRVFDVRRDWIVIKT